jgi:hypothetical protein
VIRPKPNNDGRRLGKERLLATMRAELVLFFLNLEELGLILALSASIADGALLVGNLCADNVAAVVVVHEANTLAGAALRTAADTNLVDLAGLAATRD